MGGFRGTMLRKFTLAILILLLAGGVVAGQPALAKDQPAPASQAGAGTTGFITARTTATPAAKPRLKIMPLGDSITFGWPDPAYGGYRHLLGSLLANDGYSVDFVGSQQSGKGAIPDPDNEGHPRWTISQIQDGIDTNGWLETYQPDLILLHIGTNDIMQGQAAAAPARLSALLDDILKRLPQAHIIVAQIIPDRQGISRAIVAYDAAIPAIVASKGARVSLVDMQHLLTPGDYGDIIHPNDGGYDKLARAWEAAIRLVAAAGPAAPLKTVLPPSTSWLLDAPL
jgi:lysophospholipase L1-like esterase